MSGRQNFKGTALGLVAVGILALATTAQAATFDAGIFAVGHGDQANPIVINAPGGGASPSGFLDTINFDLGPFTHFNMTSQLNNVAQGTPGVLGAFGVTIFSNNGDVEIPIGNGYNGIAESFTNVQLADLGLTRDYHLHPSGTYLAGGGSYTLTLWGSNTPAVPIPAAVWLFGSGLVGLAGVARRKMASANA